MTTATAVVRNPRRLPNVDGEAHPNPTRLKVNQAISLGHTDHASYLLWAAAEQQLLCFMRDDEGTKAVYASIISINPGHLGALAAVVRLAPQSEIQLASPADSCAVISVDMRSGSTALVVHQTGIATVTQVTQEPSFDGTGLTDGPIGEHWTVRLSFQGETHRWTVDTEHELQAGQQIRVRKTSAGYLVRG